MKEGGRRFAAVVAQTWNVTDAAAPTLQRQVILEGSLTPNPDRNPNPNPD